ncbi:DnaB-like helicase N-terminal domain-containing protein [Gemmatimonadota bacterium]
MKDILSGKLFNNNQMPTEIPMESQHTAEKLVLTAALNGGGADALQGLTSKHFQDKGHRAIYEAVNKLLITMGTVGPVELLAALEKSGHMPMVVSRDQLADMACNFVSANQIRSAIEILQRSYLHRWVIDRMRKLGDNLEKSPAESIDELETHLAVLDEDFRREAPARTGLMPIILPL